MVWYPFHGAARGERRVENLAIPWLISAFLRAWPLRSAACQVCVKCVHSCEFRFFKGYLQKLGNTDILDKRLSRQYKFGKRSVDTVRKRNDLITCNRMRTSKCHFRLAVLNFFDQKLMETEEFNQYQNSLVTTQYSKWFLWLNWNAIFIFSALAIANQICAVPTGNVNQEIGLPTSLHLAHETGHKYVT